MREDAVAAYVARAACGWATVAKLIAEALQEAVLPAACR